MECSIQTPKHKQNTPKTKNRNQNRGGGGGQEKILKTKGCLTSMAHQGPSALTVSYFGLRISFARQHILLVGSLVNFSNCQRSFSELEVQKPEEQDEGVTWDHHVLLSTTYWSNLSKKGDAEKTKELQGNRWKKDTREVFVSFLGFKNKELSWGSTGERLKRAEGSEKEMRLKKAKGRISLAQERQCQVSGAEINKIF